MTNPAGTLLPTAKTPRRTKLSDLTVYLYGPRKIGKTTFAASAPKPLFLATEPGLKALDAYQIPINSWDDLLKAGAALVTESHSFGTIVVDTIDNAYAMCSVHVCKQYSIQHPSDMPYGKGFDRVNSEFMRVISRLASLPAGLFLLGHTKDAELVSSTGKKTTKTVPALPGGPASKLTGFTDFNILVGFTTEEEPKRIMHMHSGPDFEAGSRWAGKLPPTLPLDYKIASEAIAKAIAE